MHDRALDPEQGDELDADVPRAAGPWPPRGEDDPRAAAARHLLAGLGAAVADGGPPWSSPRSHFMCSCGHGWSVTGWVARSWCPVCGRPVLVYAG